MRHVSGPTFAAARHSRLRIPTARADATTMPRRLLALALAATLASAACSVDATSEGAGAFAERNVAGEQFVLFTDARHFQARSGDSIVVPVSLFGGEQYTRLLLTEMDISALPAGISVSGMPALVDLGIDRSPAFYVVIATDVSVPVRSTGYAAIHFSDSDDVNSWADSTEGFTITVVDHATTIGPMTGIDFVASTMGGATFSPLSTDVAGDAAFDLSTLTVVEEPTSGSLAVSADGALVYLPGSPGGDRASYQICDANEMCATGEIRFWTS